jgi:hypothetical protein
MKEAIYALLKVEPDLSSAMFDFSNPYKIEIEGYISRGIFNLI